MKKDLRQPVRGTSFPEHLFTAYWQQDQFKYLLNTLMPGEVLMVVDFAKNRKASYASEVYISTPGAPHPPPSPTRGRRIISDVAAAPGLPRRG
ncbi:hypothetical protein ElyMa_002783400 [Elysia marginata]|uniref:Uncharacterized protein n=1 Tax=Elysia marginata TaxID=1093978 RepID=A0AAV4HNA2_9GAST|nr:hypothetical protein ElyMa_002783400 [Elysia marginata]